MNRLPLLAALFAASSFAFASCGNSTDEGADDDAMATDTTMMTPMATEGTMDGTMNSTDPMMSTGTTNADGSVTYPDGVVRGTDGSYKRADGTVMTMDEVKSYQAVQGKTITTDGTVKDRDGDGRVGTAEVKENVNEAANKVKEEYKDVKKDVKN